MKKINKKQQGFTLVEVIVVAVIVAVLAAVAIPLYMGYIKDARANVCQNNAASIASAFTAYMAANGDATVAICKGFISGNDVVIPALSGGENTSIKLPVGYTPAVVANGVQVNGPGSSNSAVINFTK